MISATAGFQPWLIKALGCWNSNAYMSYIHCPPHNLQTFTTLARTNASQHLGIQMNSNYLLSNIVSLAVSQHISS